MCSLADEFQMPFAVPLNMARMGLEGVKIEDPKYENLIGMVNIAVNMVGKEEVESILNEMDGLLN